MTRDEEALVERMWFDWVGDQTVTNSVCCDFFFTEIRTDRALRHINAFEVLDTIVNALPPAPRVAPATAPERAQPAPATQEQPEPA